MLVRAGREVCAVGRKLSPDQSVIGTRTSGCTATMMGVAPIGPCQPYNKTVYVPATNMSRPLAGMGDVDMGL